MAGRSAKEFRGTRVHALAGSAVARFMRLVRRTSTVTVEPADGIDRLLAAHPGIMTCWHGQFLLVPVLAPDGLPVSAMVARHGDAELIGQALASFGIELIRGAGAGGRRRDKGGARAMLGAISAMAAGRSVCMTADVPPGPARRAGMGIIMLARHAGRPIVPVGIGSSRCRVLNTWSRFTINLPYSKIALVVGEPLTVPASDDADEHEAARQTLEARLNEVTRRAWVLAGADPARLFGREPPDEEKVGGGALLNGHHTPLAPPGIALRVYRGAMTALRPATGLILGWRTRQGKEDAHRRGERRGVAGVPRPAGAVGWIHAASVGELNAVLPLVHALRSRRPDVELVVTTGTKTSAEVARSRLPEGAIHQYVPLDVPAYINRFLDHWRPDIVLLTESEIWPSLVLGVSDRKIPLCLVNARLSPRSQARWRRRPRLARALFGRFDIIMTQNERLARRLKALGAPRVETAGNLKIDAPPLPIDEAARSGLEAVLAGRPRLIAASTHPGEEEQIADAHVALARRQPGLITIIAPRHPERGAAIAKLISGRGLAVRQRSRGELPEAGTEIYVADTIGELGTFYALVPVAFIGGSLVPHGGQNPIEAVRHGAGLLTGPYHHNFKDEYGALLRARGAIEVASAAELAEHAARLLADPGERAALVATAKQTIDAMSGALERTLGAVLELLPRPEVRVAEALSRGP